MTPRLSQTSSPLSVKTTFCIGLPDFVPIVYNTSYIQQTSCYSTDTQGFYFTSSLRKANLNLYYNSCVGNNLKSYIGAWDYVLYSICYSNSKNKKHRTVGFTLNSEMLYKTIYLVTDISPDILLLTCKSHIICICYYETCPSTDDRLIVTRCVAISSSYLHLSQRVHSINNLPEYDMFVI